MRYKHFKNADADISALTVGTWGIAGANSAGVMPAGIVFGFLKITYW